MTRMKNIQALHAGISRRDWNATEQAANALRDEYELVTRILAGTDIGSLPHDRTLPEIAEQLLIDLDIATTPGRLDIVEKTLFTAANGWEGEDKLTVEQAWTILCETPDITSPEEYPDHALITMEQLGSFMARAIAPHGNAR